MQRNKTTFKALRETVGLSQLQMAEFLGVTFDAIKRWEKPGKKNPPDDCFDQLEQLYQEHTAAYETAVDIVMDAYEESGIMPEVVTLPYWRTQEDYDQYGRDPGCFSVINARTRAVAQILTYMGFSIEFIDPVERGIEAYNT